MNEKDQKYMEMKGFICLSEIGSGGFGMVYLIYDRYYKEKFALKSVHSERFNQSEVQCMKNITSPYVLNLYNYEFYCDNVYLLMEFCPSNLKKSIYNGAINEKNIIPYVHGILKSIKACHDNSISHGDIKPSNFLIDKYGRIKICDFGLSSINTDNNPSWLFNG